MDPQLRRATLAANAAQRRLVAVIRRSADAHDRAADLLDGNGRPERAAFHRNGAVMDRARADELERHIAAEQPA
jgi:hypothetical protein